MLFTVIVTALFAATAVQARRFALFDDVNFKGASWTELRDDDSACWNLNGRGDRASSVSGYGNGCTRLFRERDCKGSNWEQRGVSPTVPSFLNDHIWSFRNQC